MLVTFSTHLKAHRTRQNRSEAQSMFFPAPENLSLIRQRKFTVACRAGNVRSVLKLQREWTPEAAKSAEMV
jgi:hypothetical protein